jgi:hypothetical protein
MFAEEMIKCSRKIIISIRFDIINQFVLTASSGRAPYVGNHYSRHSFRPAHDFDLFARSMI